MGSGSSAIHSPQNQLRNDEQSARAMDSAAANRQKGSAYGSRAASSEGPRPPIPPPPPPPVPPAAAMRAPPGPPPSQPMPIPPAPRTSHSQTPSVAYGNASGRPSTSLPPPSMTVSTATSQPAERPRRGSFSFLRRSKSKYADDKTEVGPIAVNGKLTRRRKSTSKGSSRPQVAPEPPQLPVTVQLPDSSHGQQAFGGGSSSSSNINNNNNMPNGISPFPPSAYNQSRYNPNAFYTQRGYKMDSSGYASRSVSGSVSHHYPPPAEPPSDPYARTESMTNRGRYSYASSAVSSVNNPRRMRRRKDPTPFNVLVVGTKNSGKTSFIEFLCSALSKPKHLSTSAPPPNIMRSDAQAPFTSHYLETELEGERIGLTLYDSKGLERHIVDLQLREMSSFIENKFQETFNEESKVLRATGVKDTHIHCVFLVLDPARLVGNIAAASPKATVSFSGKKQRVVGGLDEDLDIELLRKLQGKTTVIPIISKADTITTAHMSFLKRTVWDTLKKLKFDPLEVLTIESDSESDYGTASSEINEDEDEQEDKTLLAPAADPNQPPQHEDIRVSTMSETVELPYLPLSVLSPDMYDPGTVGRRFPWGFADPYDAEHCDFVKLKDSVFGEWRAELRTAARDRWYEGWRTTRLRKHTGHNNSSVNGSPGMRATSSHGPAGSQDRHAMHTRQRTMSASEIGVAVSNPPVRQTVN